MEKSTEFDLLLMSSQAEMEQYLGDQTKVVQGLVLPPGFDQAVETSERLELDGYVDHWVSDAAADESRSFFEEQLTELTGKPVQIRLESNTVYTHAYGGQTVMVAYSNPCTSNTFTGFSYPRTLTVSHSLALTISSTKLNVLGPISICPGLAFVSRWAARFTALPITV